MERAGTTAYLKIAWPAPAASDPDFFPMLVLDAALTGAKGVNLWASFPGTPPQRKARLYAALVECGLASTVSGALLPTSHPFLYTLSLTATEGVSLASLESAVIEAVERLRTDGISEAEAARARRQLHARLVFENDSVTNIAHQLGYFETVAGPGFYPRLQARIDAVTPERRRRRSPAGASAGRPAPWAGSSRLDPQS